MKNGRALPLRLQLQPVESSGDYFVRGAVAAACLSAFQGGGADVLRSKPAMRRVLRHALQGGTALAAGASAARSLRNSSVTGAATATAVGAAGVVLIEYLLADRPDDMTRRARDGQETQKG